MPAQYRALWNVPGGGSGFSVLHYTIAGNGAAAQQLANDTRGFFVDLVNILPDDVDIDFDSEVIDLDESGVLTAVWPVTPPAQVAGINTSTYARAAGAVVNWATDTIVVGRRLSGRTYIVPLAGNAFDTTGIITTAARDVLIAAAEDFIAAGTANRPLRVWSRTHATSATVQSATVPIQGAVLRGRRD